jgi:TolA-binding protein
MASRSSNVRRGLVVCALAAGVTLMAQAPAPDRKAADLAAQRAAERIRALQKESEALASQERTLLVELRKLEVERALK